MTGSYATLPALLVLAAVFPLQGRSYGWDLRAFVDGGQAFLHHRSPYPVASLSALTSQDNFVYPLPVAALFAPLALLPYPVLVGLFLGLSTACIVLTLQILNVRDRLCYAAALLALPAQYAVKLGTISPLLALGLALLWRYRDRRAIAATALAALVVAKLFLWPLAVWLIATRRVKTTVAGAAAAIAAVLLALVPAGYGAATYRDYPRLLHLLSAFESGWSFSVVGFGRALGLPLSESIGLAFVLGGVLLLGVLALGRQGREFDSFRVAIAAAFALSPIVWPHYFVLLLVPLAIATPRFSLVWLALAWVPPQTIGYESHQSLWILAALIGAGLQLSGGSWGRIQGRLEALRCPAFAAAGMAALAAALVVSAAAGNSQRTAVAALVPLGQGAIEANGTALLSVNEGQRRLCLRLWTESVAAGRVVATLSEWTRVVASRRLTLDRDGVGGSCSTLGRSSKTDRLLRAVVTTPARFRLTLALRTRPVLLLAGELQRPIDAGRRG